MTRARRLMAARYLRCLGTIEVLIAEGNMQDVRRLIDGIDREECIQLATELEAKPGAARGTSRSRLRLLAAPGPTYRKVW